MIANDNVIGNFTIYTQSTVIAYLQVYTCSKIGHSLYVHIFSTRFEYAFTKCISYFFP